MLADAYKNRTLLFYSTNQPQRSLAEAEAYLALKPAEAGMINMKGLALQQLGRMPEAEQAFTRSIELEPQNGAYYMNRARFYSQTGDKARAKADAERAQALGRTVDPALLD